MLVSLRTPSTLFVGEYANAKKPDARALPEHLVLSMHFDWLQPCDLVLTFPFLSHLVSPRFSPPRFRSARSRMMMTSGQAVKYKSSFDCFQQVLRNEGAASLFKGAGANILRAVAGAGVLAGYDQLQ